MNAPGTINHVTVTLNGVELSSPYYLTSLLVGPLNTTADSLDLFSDVGGSTPMTSPVNVKLDDSASSLLSTGAAGSALTTGSFKPTSGKGSDTFFASSDGFYTPPSSPYPYAAPIGSATLDGTYENQNPNGTWSLYLNQVNQSANSSMSSWCVNLTENPPVLAITKSHTGDFTQGGPGAYSVVVTNNGPGSTGGTVSVTDNPPTGLTVASMSGNGWNCSGSTCTRSDALAEGNSYDTITVSVSVASNAPSSVTNSVTVSGGGATGTATATDQTTINPAPALSISKSHTGTFTQGQTAEWDVQVSNTSVGSSTNGTVTVQDTLPTGYTAANFASTTGWSCSGTTAVTCTSTQSVAGGSSFPVIQIIVNVPSNSPASVTNNAAAYGGGDLNHTNSGNAAIASDTVNNVVQVFTLTTTANPSNGGTITANPTNSTGLPSGQYVAGAVVTLTANPNPPYTFQNWSGSADLSSTTNNPTTITMNAAESVTANFANTVNVSVGASPAGLAFSVDGTPYSSTQNFTWTVGTQHTIATNSPQGAGGTQYTFAGWSDSGAISHGVTATTGVTSYTASFNATYQLTTAANPSGGGTVTPASGTYYAANAVVNLTATPNPNYAFSNWTGNVANANNAATTVTMTAPQTVTANFVGAGVVLSKTSLNFGTVFLNSRHKLSVILTNESASLIKITGVTITPGTADAAAYQFVEFCAQPLLPGKSCAIGVIFKADAAGTLTATLNVAYNGPGSPQSVSLTANVIDPAATFSPKPLIFARQAVNSQTTLPVQLTNGGQTDLTISSITIGGSNAGDFSQTNNCPSALSPTDSCTIEVTFTPVAAGTRGATLTVSDNVAGGKSTDSLKGIGH